MKVLAQFKDPLTPCAKISTVIEKFAPPPLSFFNVKKIKLVIFLRQLTVRANLTQKYLPITLLNLHFVTLSIDTFC